jgi:hypothetical protein
VVVRTAWAVGKLKLEHQMSDYWALRAFTKFGSAIALLGAVSVPAVAAGAMALSTWNWVLFAGAVGAGVLVGFLIKVFSELARVIVEMLLPLPG